MTIAKQTVLKSFAAVVHDHGRCVTTALAKAETACATAGKRLTPLRRRVLELVWGSHLPVKAYDLLAILGREREQAAPPTVYRALDFLQQVGLVHRIASLNAFVGCGEPLQGHVSQFLICTQCGTVAELANLGLSTSISASAEALGFQATRQTIEVEGICKHCRKRGAQAVQ
ncbi:MAG: transcriptional repressor [Gammaproteobacteria bacterium]|nr:transcriptional repressor [Gammaproteobacteria bacterium]